MIVPRPRTSGQQIQGWLIVITLGSLLTTAGLAVNFNRDGDFDGDGRMDPAVYDEPTGEWHIMLSGDDFKVQSFVWGGPGWTAIKSDYDGDGRADIVVYNRTTGKWYILPSGNGYKIPISFNFGGDGWSVVTADYDGDGLTDPTIYRETTGELQSKLSLIGYPLLSGKLGDPGDIAVSGDFDGDGYSDPATYRRSDGRWLVQFSSEGYATKLCSVDTKGDGPLVPSPADYDGDRKTDPAVFAYSAPSFLGKQYVFAWHLLSSRQNFRQVESFYHLGREDCEPSNADPAPGDYDGDGKADYAVSWPNFESANVMWRNWWSSNFDGSNHMTVKRWAGTNVHPVQR